ncbi:MAG: hypothetical protein NZ455_04470 [Bacteroidia bacterium]|nr:hypothetical protein [Bacteroidia bacterium]MDW8347791.1 hypothetical protein [Bacteroidia bacterium]
MRHAEGASAVRSTEAIAQPAARRPERSEGHAQKSNYLFFNLISIDIFWTICKKYFIRM